jgi:hypothetical protein
MDVGPGLEVILYHKTLVIASPFNIALQVIKHTNSGMNMVEKWKAAGILTTKHEMQVVRVLNPSLGVQAMTYWGIDTWRAYLIVDTPHMFTYSLLTAISWVAINQTGGCENFHLKWSSPID